MSTNWIVRVLAVAAVGSALSAVPAVAGDWSRQGADAGMSKYTADNLAVDAPLHLRYSKRFYGKWTDNKPNFFYGSSIVTRDGKAAMIADDRSSPPASNYLTAMKFTWATGQSLDYFMIPWLLSEHCREIDSHHYTNPIIWHSDGRIYGRRGGDYSSTWVILPATNTLYRIYNRDANKVVLTNGFDATALMQCYKDLLICRHGHTQSEGEFYAGLISAGCFVAPNNSSQPVILGQRFAWTGPTVPATAGAEGIYGYTSRFGDIPKCAADVCVYAAQINATTPLPYGTRVFLQATDLVSGQTLWTRHWSSDYGGQQGFYTSVSDYWRFMALENGLYVFFTRQSGQPVTVHAVDLRTGQDRWSLAMANANERPLLAYAAGCVYVVGRAEQYKLDAATGATIWQTTNSFAADQGYVMHNWEDQTWGSWTTQDPIYRPVVLTDETLWFVDGDYTSNPPQAKLLALRTSDGRLVRQMDLAALYAGKPESLLVVNDVLVADGLLGVLVGVKNANSAHPHSNNMDFQDLYVFEPVQGDIDGDGHCDIVDLLTLAAAFGSVPGETNYDLPADLNQDDSVDVVDLLSLAGNFGN